MKKFKKKEIIQCRRTTKWWA